LPCLVADARRTHHDRAPFAGLEPAAKLHRPIIESRRQAHRGATVQITLQSTVGGFEPAFMRRLPLLEQAMIAHDLDPADFVISKDRAVPLSAIPFVGPFFYDYTVFVCDQNFTVTEPNDTRFLQYFYQRIIAPEQAAPSPQHKRAGVISRLLQWMDQPI
jgi:hypothetical protein